MKRGYETGLWIRCNACGFEMFGFRELKSNGYFGSGMCPKCGAQLPWVTIEVPLPRGS